MSKSAKRRHSIRYLIGRRQRSVRRPVETTSDSDRIAISRLSQRSISESHLARQRGGRVASFSHSLPRPFAQVIKVMRWMLAVIPRRHEETPPRRFLHTGGRCALPALVALRVAKPIRRGRSDIVHSPGGKTDIAAPIANGYRASGATIRHREPAGLTAYRTRVRASAPDATPFEWSTIAASMQPLHKLISFAPTPSIGTVDAHTLILRSSVVPAKTIPSHRLCPANPEDQLRLPVKVARSTDSRAFQS